MSSRRWAFHSDVLGELRAAAEWYERRAAGLGEDFVALFERHLEEAAASAHPGTLVFYVRRAEVRWLLLTPRFPYGIVLLLDDSRAVIALARLRRKPGYWRKRLRQRPSVRRARAGICARYHPLSGAVLLATGGRVMQRLERPPVSRVREIRTHGLKGGLALTPVLGPEGK
jgi:hypothetical protein